MKLLKYIITTRQDNPLYFNETEEDFTVRTPTLYSNPEACDIIIDKYSLQMCSRVALVEVWL